jgi:dTDP-4-dehydrorhamnose 3,5-epimerase
MVQHLITGVTITELKIIKGGKGDVLRMLRSEPDEVKTIGEAYFSTVNHDTFKGWKQHTKMQLNIAVPVGRIKFFLLNNNGTKTETASIELSVDNYHLLTVEPGVWMGFKGMDEGLNMLLNVASIPHDPEEAVNEPEDKFMHFFV